MKLKSDFYAQNVGDVQFLIPLQQDVFHGIIKSNSTAAFILEQLREETTQEKIVDALCDEYDADRQTIAEDTAQIIESLRKINAIVE